MQFDIVEAPVERGIRPTKYSQIPHLKVGEGLRLPWGDLSVNDPAGGVRSIAWMYGKRLPGRKFRTETHGWGMLLLRVA
jgi:hypothetical protein